MANLGSFGAAARDGDPQSEPDQFEFYGDMFTVAARVGVMPLLRFAVVAEAGTDAEDMAGLAAMHELLRDCLVTDDWSRFQKIAADNKATADELMSVCAAVYEAVSGRPTTRPSDSPDGSSEIGPPSKAALSSVTSSKPTWRDTPFGRRELSAVPELYEDILSVTDNGSRILAG